MSAKVEEVVSSSSDEDTDDEMPELESADVANADAGASAGGKQNRAEKKSRKAIQKLGMKPVSGIKRVTIKKAKNVRVMCCSVTNEVCFALLLLWPVCT
jgi:nascent polypeptide-associated complex subunit alpha